MPGAVIEEGAKVEFAIVAENAVIGKNAKVGASPSEVKNRDDWGVTVIGDNIKIGDNVTVPPKAMIDKDMEG
jgi:glucose-1-phosphate adenylyltransferase